VGGRLFFRNAYMKRVDKPTKHGCDNLLNFQKKPDISPKMFGQSKLSGYLKKKTSLLWLPISELSETRFLENQIFHVHPKPEQDETGHKGEQT